MASSSDNNLEDSFDETFNQYLHSRIWLSMKKMKGGQEKNECLSKEIAKKAIFVYGMIISVIVQHILKMFSDDGLE